MKIDRLLAIVMLLLNRRLVSAKELAQYFEVSQRTIYRDIESINQAGIPVVSYMGTDGGFGIIENFKINRNFLTNDEISSILTALGSVNSTIDSRQVANTLEKIKGMLGNSDEKNLEKNSFPVHIDYSSWNSSSADKETLRLVNKAIDEKRIIEFDYINSRGVEIHRTVEPLTLILKDFSWYLHGYCQTRKDFRLFKLKRIDRLAMGNDFFTREAPTIGELNYMEEWCSDSPNLNIVLKFSPAVKLRIVDSFRKDQINFNNDGTGLVHFTFPENEWLFELLLGFGSEIEVLEPLHLRQLLRKKALEIANLY